MTFKVSRHFRPKLLSTIALFLLAALFTSLGGWQTNRASEKLATEQLHLTAKNVSLESALQQNLRFARVEIHGRYDPIRHVLLDNQIWKGRAGVHVFTPFYTNNGAAILVNRGWLPLAADRKTLPEVPTPMDDTNIKGMLNILPVPGLAVGEPDSLEQDQWPQLVTYLNRQNIADSTQSELEDWVVQLAPTDISGFQGRDWKPVFMSSDRHKAYAFQWFSLTTACIALWLVTSFRKISGNKP